MMLLIRIILFRFRIKAERLVEKPRGALGVRLLVLGVGLVPAAGESVALAVEHHREAELPCLGRADVEERDLVTDEPAALEAKQTDAIWIFYGWGGINAELRGMDFDYWNFRDINPVFDYYTPVIIANNAFLEESPDVARAFMEATAKGYEYAVENPKEAADMLIEGDNTGSLSGSQDLVYASQEWISGQYVSDASAWGVIDPARWDAFYTWLYENKLTDTDLTGKGYSNDYLPGQE